MLYAIATLNGMLPQMKKSIDEMKERTFKRKERLEKNKDLKINYDAIAAEEEAFKKKILDIAYDGLLIIDELKRISNVTIKNEKEKYERALQKFLRADDFEDKLFEVEDLYYILEELRCNNQRGYTTYSGDHYNDAIQNTLTNTAIDTLFNLSNINRKANVIQNRCGNGKYLGIFKDIHSSSETYGIIGTTNDYANSKSKVRALKKIIDNVALGFPAKISNESFDVLVAPCPISGEYSDNYKLYNVKKIEREYLEDSFKYLRQGAIMLITIPRFRLTKDMCLMLSRKISNFHAFRLEEDDYDICYIIANYSKNLGPDNNIYDTLRSYCYAKNLPLMSEVNALKYNMPNMFVEIKDFKGSIVDEDEILNFIKKDSALKNMIEMQKVEKLGEIKKRPLLPFKVGQVGLVLTSGCLDGLIDEGDGHFHLVKGMVNKQYDSTRENTGMDNFREDIITSNRVEINVILPDGTLKKIT